MKMFGLEDGGKSEWEGVGRKVGVNGNQEGVKRD